MAELITVTGENPYLISFFKDNMLVLRAPCFVGKNGITQSKCEGDMATPAGIFEITAAFGTAPNPGTELPYFDVTENTYLVDDPGSEYYNRIVDIRKIVPDFKSAEKMNEFPGYKYGAVINYNPENISGKGSGIFLHCASKPYTAGCVSADETVIEQILKSITPNVKIIIGEPEARQISYRFQIAQEWRLPGLCPGALFAVRKKI